MRVRLFQVLPWYVRVFIHTLALEFDGVPAPVPTSSAASSAHANANTNTTGRSAIEGIRWVPGADRRRPSVLELQVLVPAHTSVARISVGFEKAFLRLTEFPPDANRGFDLPAALLLLPPPDPVRYRCRGGGGGSSGRSGDGGGGGGGDRDGGGDGGSGGGRYQYHPLLDAMEGMAAPDRGRGEGKCGTGAGQGGAAAAAAAAAARAPDAVYLAGSSDRSIFSLYQAPSRGHCKRFH